MLILIYQGTFDPPHFGHKIVALEALRLLNADKVSIIPTLNNKYKPNASDRVDRLAMVQILFKDEPLTTVWSGTKDEALHFFRNDSVALVIGADTWTHVRLSSEINIKKYNKLIIISRPGYDLPNIKEFHGVPVTILNIDYPVYSSSTIRSYLASPDFYTKNLRSNLLDTRVLEYIRERKLYLFPYLRETIYKLTNFYDIKLLTGRSGDPTFKVDGSIIKVFIPDNGRLNREIRASELFISLRLRDSITSSVQWARIVDDIGYISFSYLPGYDFGYYLRNDTSVMEIARRIGRSLTELHRRQSIIPSGPFFDNFINRLRSRIDRSSLNEFEELLQNYRRNPGHWTYVHGDSNPGNFIWTDETIGMIDLGSMVNYIDPKGLPIGYPGYEFYQFLSSLTWYSRMNGLTNPETIARATQGFLQGYDRTLITPEADRFFKFYWCQR